MFDIRYIQVYTIDMEGNSTMKTEEGTRRKGKK